MVVRLRMRVDPFPLAGTDRIGVRTVNKLSRFVHGNERIVLCQFHRMSGGPFVHTGALGSMLMLCATRVPDPRTWSRSNGHRSRNCARCNWSGCAGRSGTRTSGSRTIGRRPSGAAYLRAIVDEMRRQGIDPAGTSLRLGILGAEPWTEDMRREIEQRLDIHAVDIYGLSEVMGPGVANECVETKDGLHVWEDHFYPEIIDPLTGAVLPDGERGELVFTSLTKEAMPVIRYRTRDLTRLLPGTARPMRRIEKITGRTDDMMIVRGVNVFPTQIEELILRLPPLSPHFQCVLRRDGRLDTPTVRVERRPQARPGAAAEAGVTLADQVKNLIGVSIDVAVIEPDTVERSLGKMRRIVDER